VNEAAAMSKFLARKINAVVFEKIADLNYYSSTVKVKGIKQTNMNAKTNKHDEKNRPRKKQ